MGEIQVTASLAATVAMETSASRMLSWLLMTFPSRMTAYAWARSEHHSTIGVATCAMVADVENESRSGCQSRSSQG
jgi:hypothetical protein